MNRLYLEKCKIIKQLRDQQSSAPSMSKGLVTENIRQARFSATDLVAAERGWKRAKRYFSIRQLLAGAKRKSGEDYLALFEHDLFDHREFFKKDGIPAAIIAHLYRKDPGQIVSEATEKGLKAEFLPVSCYWPDSTLTVIYTPL